MSREHKVQVGIDYDLFWKAPKAVLTAPTVTVQWSDGNETVLMTNSGPQTIDSVDARDRTKLTLDTPTLDPDEIGENGAAWLLTDTMGVMSVKMVSFSGGVVTLAEPLNRAYTPSADDVLISAYWKGTIGARSTAERDVRLRVAYEHNLSATGATANGIETGVVHAVYQPFYTGLTSDEVSSKLLALGSPAAGGQGWDDQIEMAEEELILMIRDELASDGLMEDDLTSPQSLRACHLLLTAAIVNQISDFERSTGLRARAKELFVQVMRRIHLDSAKDGYTPQAEVAVVTGAKYPVRTSGNSSTSRRFSVTMEM